MCISFAQRIVILEGVVSASIFNFLQNNERFAVNSLGFPYLFSSFFLLYSVDSVKLAFV